MISYSRDPQETIPTSAVKIIGLGGAGANMLERIALDGLDGAELLALNTDIRTLHACLAQEKIQLGLNLTKGLGAGGDPELGHQAVLEAENEIRAAVKGRRIVFLCTGLGGGTGSGAAPIVTRIAREEGAFVVVFATMPFAFEGRRRREQAETALNELAVLSNALVTFDNNRMGELVLAKQGIHEAFAAADEMICESIKAVIRLVARPGLINVGLDDLMSALRTTRSRCLFGSGISNGKDRAARALRNALASPLLDQGSLLKDAQTVLVHLCGGEDLTLFEIELLMQRLQKFVPEKAHVLFGAAIDPGMRDSLSITLISALPEDALVAAPREAISHSLETPDLDPSDGFTAVKSAPAEEPPAFVPPPLPEYAPAPEPENISVSAKPEPVIIPEPEVESAPAPTAVEEVLSRFEAEPEEEPAPAPLEKEIEQPTLLVAEPAAPPVSPLSKFSRTAAPKPEPGPSLFDDERPFAEPAFTAVPTVSEPEEEKTDAVIAEAEPVPAFTVIEEEEEEAPAFTPIPKKKPTEFASWGRAKTGDDFPEDLPEEAAPISIAPEAEAPAPKPESQPEQEFATAGDVPSPKLKLGVKPPANQSELFFDSAPRGRFEGENPNVFEGEDLDLPPFLRKKRS